LRVHILTAVTRPENLPEIARSIAEAAQKTEYEIVWHWRFDPELRHVGGQALKNKMLDGIEEGWVVFLDDDTIMHPDLLATVARSSARAVVVSQDGGGLEAKRGNVHVGTIDIGQAVIDRKLIANERIPLEYAGDGEFLQRVLGGVREVRFVKERLAYYNALR
jgi:hypothetical protein